MTFTYLFSQVKYFITWYRKFTLCKASKNATNCVETETPKWTWDMWQKDFDPSLHKNMSPFWWTKKRGLFLPPSLPYGPMSPSQQFFFWMLPLLEILLWLWLVDTYLFARCHKICSFLLLEASLSIFTYKLPKLIQCRKLQNLKLTIFMVTETCHGIS